MGPFREESLSGFRFCRVFADQYPKFVFVDLLKVKSEALASLRIWLIRRKRIPGVHTQHTQGDGSSRFDHQ